jgi:two-component system sensor kinase FixL
LREISGVLVHEITQPLTAILGDAEAALRLLEDSGEVRVIVQDIIASVLRATEILKGLRLMLNGDELSCEPCPFNEIVSRALQHVAQEIDSRDIDVRRHVDIDLHLVKVDRVQIEQVIVNLLLNACEAMEAIPKEQRLLRLVIRSTDLNDVELVVGDSGKGVAPCEHEHIFEPFVTTKARGLGLGLAICRLIVNAHGGQLWAEPADRGARFCLSLPKAF